MNDNPMNDAVYQEILPEDLDAWLAKGARIIDVREAWEYDRGHLPGARNIPLGEIEAHVDELEGPLVLVCASGNRSAQAAQYLASRGREVANLMGGTSGWARRGYPLEREGGQNA